MIGSFLRTAGDIGISRVDRHVAPAQQHLALGLDRALHLLLAGQAGGVFLGQEDHADAVFAGRRQFDALLGHLFAVQRVGQLQQDAGAVAHQLVRAHRAPVVQVLQDQQRLLDDVVALLALDMGHEADAARVVLVRARNTGLVLANGRSRQPSSWRAPHGDSGKPGGYCTAAPLPSRIIGVRTQLICTLLPPGFNWGQIKPSC
jgi:hypothetical protein